MKQSPNQGLPISDDRSINPVVVIPVHKPMPTDWERTSLARCGVVLQGSEIIVLAPESIRLDEYYEILPSAKELRVKDECMASLRAYNRLMIAAVIFRELQQYSHALIHEPDAIVVDDQLDYWCRQPYDFIGAPWFEGYRGAKSGARPIGVGNFGFSLLRVQGCLDALSSNARWFSGLDLRNAVARSIEDLLGGRPHEARRRLACAWQGVGQRGRLANAYEIFPGNCDAFWGLVVPRVANGFRVAPVECAVCFAWEVQPRECAALTGYRLPFGLHAWGKYDPDFVLPLLARQGIGFPDLGGLGRHRGGEEERV